MTSQKTSASFNDVRCPNCKEVGWLVGDGYDKYCLRCDEIVCVGTVNDQAVEEAMHKLKNESEIL